MSPGKFAVIAKRLRKEKDFLQQVHQSADNKLRVRALISEASTPQLTLIATSTNIITSHARLVMPFSSLR